MFNRMAYAAIALVALSGSATYAIAEEHSAALVASGLGAPGTQHVMAPDSGHWIAPIRREPSSAAMLLAVLGLGSFLAVRRTNSNQ